jgi:hypothetical protein
MKEIYEGRWIARLDEPFVVLLIGMRINKLWHVHRWLPLVFQMGRMLRELHTNRAKGFLGGKTWFGRTTVLIQYWRSMEDMEHYATIKHSNRTPAWVTFYEAVEATDSVGAYHELYAIEQGRYDNSFINMPRTLLSSVAPICAVGGPNGISEASLSSPSPLRGPAPRFWGF